MDYSLSHQYIILGLKDGSCQVPRLEELCEHLIKLLKDTVLAFGSGRGHLRGGPADPERLDCRRLEEKTAGTATSCTLVFLSALLTG